MRPAGLHTNAQPVTEREPSCAPEYLDPRDRPIEFGLTPRERDAAAMAAIHLEANRRRLNARQPHIERNARKGSEL